MKWLCLHCSWPTSSQANHIHTVKTIFVARLKSLSEALSPHCTGLFSTHQSCLLCVSLIQSNLSNAFYVKRHCNCFPIAVLLILPLMISCLWFLFERLWRYSMTKHMPRNKGIKHACWQSFCKKKNINQCGVCRKLSSNYCWNKTKQQKNPPRYLKAMQYVLRRVRHRYWRSEHPYRSHTKMIQERAAVCVERWWYLKEVLRTRIIYGFFTAFFTDS